MRIAFGLVIVCTAGVATAQVVDLQVSIKGSVNEGIVAADGTGMVDLNREGESSATVQFADRPMDFDPQGVSLLSNICANAFRDDGEGAQNLFVLGEGNYSVSRSFQWLGYSGAVFMDSSVSFDGKSLMSDSVISGSYGGPTDIVGITGYQVIWIPSSTAGEFFEAGTAILNRASGEQVVMQFASIYTGLTNSLLSTQFGVGSFETTFADEVLTVSWDGEFAVPTPGSMVVAGLMSLIATRRRR